MHLLLQTPSCPKLSAGLVLGLASCQPLRRLPVLPRLLLRFADISTPLSLLLVIPLHTAALQLSATTYYC